MNNDQDVAQAFRPAYSKAKALRYKYKTFFALCNNLSIFIDYWKGIGQGSNWHRRTHPRGKIVEDISKKRRLPKGMDALSPALLVVLSSLDY